jgi:hypothetical protein
MTFRSSNVCIAATLASLAFVTASPSLDAAHAALPVGTACSALLAKPTLDSISEAPGHIVSANVVAAKYPNPEYCDLKGEIAPQIQFELRLPTSWNGRYLQGSSAGPPGAMSGIRDCGVALERDFAVGFSNVGHTGAAIDGAPHALALAAKAILIAFYGEPPHHAYLDACSEGGKEALSEAERYPNDFDGIIAVSPGHRWAGLSPDLSEFRNRGGKLIIWHGWADRTEPPAGTVGYYAAMRDRMGGLGTVQTFARLFMFPGISHCSGTAPCPSCNLIEPLVSWVERGTAPNEVLFTEEEAATNTAPVFPYPMRTKRIASGSIE